MSLVNWARFDELPGAPTANFERLCRAIVYRHFGRYGSFRYTKNQPGIEFSLLLESDCELGKAGSWFGWQCRWYDLPRGRSIGTARRKKISAALRLSESEYPGLTDWILCTREPLTVADQAWFNALTTRLKLHLWTNEEVEDLLNGPALPLRTSYFGEHILSSHDLVQLHETAVSPIKSKWIPEVHVEVTCERNVNQLLFAPTEWECFSDIGQALMQGLDALSKALDHLPERLRSDFLELKDSAKKTLASVNDVRLTISNGDMDAIRMLPTNFQPILENRSMRRLQSRLRAINSPLALPVTNITADIGSAIEALEKSRRLSFLPLVAIHGRAGEGKTELAIRLTEAQGTRPAGMLLMGNRLKARESLDALARTVVIHGEPCTSFESLVEALDAAAQRSHCRLPIIIDSLGEAERPSDWSAALASASAIVMRYPHILLVVTLRTEFVDICLPEDTLKLELSGFRNKTEVAMQKYFEYFRIDAGDAGIPKEFVEHPLMLRMFCEVTNPGRTQVVGAAGMPASLTALFDRHLEQVAKRVAEQTERPSKLYPNEVHIAIKQIGRVIWELDSRFVDLHIVRARIGDADRNWDFSIIRLLESEGVLVRNAYREADNLVCFGYDLLAGHVIADALLKEYGGNLSEWFRETSTKQKFLPQKESAHPLSSDIFKAMVGLAPRRLQGEQLWKSLSPQYKRAALLSSMELEAAQLDEATTLAIRGTIIEDRKSSRRIFTNLRRTRALSEHPLNADFLDATLKAMTNNERDLYWTEWLRKEADEVRDDLEKTQAQFDSSDILTDADFLRARWTVWVLTSTVRPLRDQATQTLYTYGRKAPRHMVRLVAESLAISDPYVPERVLCAAYGVALSSLSPLSDESKRFVVELAREVVRLMFVPNALFPTTHVLAREYALGIISIARMLDPDVVDKGTLDFLVAPFSHLPSPFDKLDEIDLTAIKDADREAIRMDFGNYTMGRLVSGRHNYDMEHLEYQEMRRLIVARMVQLGYSASEFEAVDRNVAEASWRHGRGERGKLERYGKKYSWIALLEMHGVRRDQGKMEDHRIEERCSEADLDPCFPKESRAWSPELKPLFKKPFKGAVDWMSGNTQPDYSSLLKRKDIDGKHGPWVMLDGYLNEAAITDDRELFTFIQGAFVAPTELSHLLQEFNNIDYPGNNQIPSGAERYYTYLGEMPFARDELPMGTGNGIADPPRDAFDRYIAGTWKKGIGVFPPTQTYAWESYHSPLNLGGGAVLPSVTLCTELGLRYQPGSFDLVDDAGIASVFRRLLRNQGGVEALRGNVCYLREDLLRRFTSETGLIFVRFIWGERGFHHRSNLADSKSLRAIYATHKHMHHSSEVWAADL